MNYLNPVCSVACWETFFYRLTPNFNREVLCQALKFNIHLTLVTVWGHIRQWFLMKIDVWNAAALEKQFENLLSFNVPGNITPFILIFGWRRATLKSVVVYLPWPFITCQNQWRVQSEEKTMVKLHSPHCVLIMVLGLCVHSNRWLNKADNKSSSSKHAWVWPSRCSLKPHEWVVQYHILNWIQCDL